MVGLFHAFALVSIAALVDLRSRRIPNWLTGASALASIATAIATGRWVDPLIGAGIAVLACSAFERFWGRIGGGDEKLCVALGMALGPVGFLQWTGFFAIAFSSAPPPRIARPGSLFAFLAVLALAFVTLALSSSTC